MADIKTPEERSRNMAAIKGKDTKPEMYLRKLLYSKGYRYRKNFSQIPGHPDIWLAKYRTAIFVHGCYWHRHPGCKYAYTPKSNAGFWASKFDDNVQRDKKIVAELSFQGIRCLVMWECTLNAMRKNENMALHTLSEIESFLASDRMYLEI